MVLNNGDNDAEAVDLEVLLCVWCWSLNPVLRAHLWLLLSWTLSMCSLPPTIEYLELFRSARSKVSVSRHKSESMENTRHLVTFSCKFWTWKVLRRVETGAKPLVEVLQGFRNLLPTVPRRLQSLSFHGHSIWLRFMEHAIIISLQLLVKPSVTICNPVPTHFESQSNFRWLPRWSLTSPSTIHLHIHQPFVLWLPNYDPNLYGVQFQLYL